MATEVGQAQIKLSFDTKTLKSSMDSAENTVRAGGSSSGSAWGNAWTVAAGNLISKGLSKITSAITSNLDRAIQRVDTIANSKKVFTAMGYAVADVSKSMDKLNGYLDGLPTSMTDAVQGVQSLSASFGGIEFGTELFIAMNNAGLAFGATTDQVSNAINQLGQLSLDGPLDAQTWNSLRNSGFGPVFAAMAKEAGITVGELKEQFGGRGTKTVKDFTEALIKMDKNGTKSMDSLANLAKANTEGIGTAIENVKNRIGRALAEVLNSLGQQRISNAINKISYGFINVGKAVGKVAKSLAPVFDWAIEHTDLLAKAVTGLMAAFAVKKILNWTKSLSSLAIELTAQITKTIALSAAQQVYATTLGLSASSFSLASKAAAVFNAVLSANPIGAVLIAITALVGALVLLHNIMRDSAHDEYMAKMREEKELIEDDKNAYSDLVAEQQKQVTASLSQINTAQALYSELQNLVDENGRVKEGYEGRAQFITGQLRDALGLEIELVDGVVKGYSGIKDSIDDVIKQKKAKIILDAQEALYKEAVEKENQAYQRQAELSEQLWQKKVMLGEVETEMQEKMRQGDFVNALILFARLKRLESEYNATEENYNAQLDLLNHYAHDKAQYESNMALFTEGKYDEMTNATFEYTSKLAEAGDKQKAELENQIQVAELKLNMYKQLWEDTGNDIYKGQVESAEKVLEQLKSDLSAYNSTTETKLGETEQIWLDNLNAQLATIKGHNVQFQSAGDGLVKAVVDGIVSEESYSQSEAESLAQSLVDEVNDKEATMNEAGTALVNGVTAGLKNGSATSGLFAAIGSLASSIVNRFKKALGIESPSKVMRDVIGKNMALGVGVGFEGTMDAVGKEMNQTMVDSLDDAGFSSSMSVNVGRGVTDWSGQLVSAFDDEMTSGNNDFSAPAPAVINLNLDGQQIEQVILQDVRRAI